MAMEYNISITAFCQHLNEIHMANNSRLTKTNLILQSYQQSILRKQNNPPSLILYDQISLFNPLALEDLNIDNVFLLNNSDNTSTITIMYSIYCKVVHYLIISSVLKKICQQKN